MKICHSCGASNTDAAKFCVECGVAVKSTESQQQNPASTDHRSQSNISRTSPTVITPTVITQRFSRSKDHKN